MASSSHAASTSSSSRSYKYDVFLSFRGEDVRKTFVDHLYSALVNKQIQTYKDDETLSRGDSIRPALFKAIEESRIALVIFSKNYADSSWCLDELSHIMKCKKERELLVMPVFYDVDPSDVRKRKRDFGEAFAKLEVENVNKAETWRNALTDASDIAGWEPKYVANGHESKVIKEIVDTILERLLPIDAGIDEDLVGMTTRVKDLKSLLDIGSECVRMVGIWGCGGSGKTTLATSLYMEIRKIFQDHCILENVREESSKFDLKKLQEKMLSAVLKKEVTVYSVVEGKHMIKAMLCSRNVLIILDDVNNLDQLNALAGSHKWFGNGSRIIVTTRDEHLLKTHKVDQVCNVQLLSDKEAIRLFNIHAYNESDPIEDYKTLSLRVVSYAAGLPLAIKVLGSFLYDKEKKEWMSTLARLKDIPEMEIVEVLKISYDGLKNAEKELFLDIACLWRHCFKIDAMESLEACGYHPEIGLKVLRQNALITVSRDGRFDMHDLIQEMGHYIVRGEHPNNPKNHSRIWKHEVIDNMCFGNATTEHEKIEVIKYHHYEGDVASLCKIVSNVKRLRYLDVDINGSVDSVEGPTFLSNELCYFKWEEYPVKSPFPDGFQPTKLVVLKLKDSLQEEIWKGCKHLPHLKVLELRWMKELQRTPNFDGLPSLQKLELSNCNKLKEIDPSLGNHKTLQYLTISDCRKLRMFPTITHLENLKNLRIYKCPKIQANMEGLHLPHLKVLQLSYTYKLLRTPNFDGLPSLQKLKLSYWPKLKEIDPSLGNHTNLQYVNVSNCRELRMFPTITHLENLKDLKIYKCRKLLEFPKIQANMEGLLRFYMRETGIEVLPSSIGECCTNLISLQLSDLENLKSIQFNFHALKHLQVLKLEQLYYLYLQLFGTPLEIPSSIIELSNLQELDLSGNDFSRLDFSLSQLTRLKHLNMSYCKKLVELPELPSSLSILDAIGCKSLTTLGDCYKNCRCLSQVSLIRRGSMINDVDRLVEFMVEVNENHFMLLDLPGLEIAKGFTPPLLRGRRCTLQLPDENWCNDYSGFLICFVMSKNKYWDRWIDIKMSEEMNDMDSQQDILWEENDSDQYTKMVYVSFDLLRETKWWDQTYKYKSLYFQSNYMDCYGYGVRLVEKKRRGGLMEASTNHSSPYNPNFNIISDSTSDLFIEVTGYSPSWEVFT